MKPTKDPCPDCGSPRRWIESPCISETCLARRGEDVRAVSIEKLIQGYPLSQRLYVALVRAGIHTVGDLERVGEIDWGRIRNCGRVTIAEMRSLLVMLRVEPALKRNLRRPDIAWVAGF